MLLMLISCSITMSALALIFMVLTPLLSRRYGAKGRYYAWLAIVIGLLIPFRPQLANAPVQITIPNEVAQWMLPNVGATPMLNSNKDMIRGSEGSAIGTITKNASATAGNANRAITDTAVPPATAPVLFPPLPLAQALLFTWLLGALSFLAYHAARHTHFLRMAKRWSEPVTDEVTPALLKELATALGMKQRISV